MKNRGHAKGLAPPDGHTGLRRPRRRWWQIVCRWAVVVVLVVAGAYVTLPWWAPRRYLRSQLAAALSRQFGAAVTVRELSLDWARGVEIRGLAVASEGADGEPMLSVEQARAELAPVSLVLRRRIGWLELVKPRLSVRIGSNGELDRAGLGRASDVTFGRVSIHQGAAVLKLPDRDQALHLSIASLELYHNASGRQGSLTMVAALEQDGGEAPFTVRLAFASGREVVAFASMNFSNLDLQGLGVAKLLNLPLRKLEGLSKGSLDVQVDRRGMVNEFNLSVSAANLSAQAQNGPELPVVDEAVLGITASFDPFTGLVNIRDLRLRLPGAELAGEAEITADLYEGRLEALRSLDLRGQVQPASLAALIGGQGGLPGQVEVDGPVRLHVASRCDGMRIALDLTAQADSTVLRRGRQLLKGAGTRLDLEVKGELDRRNWLFAAEQAELALGDNRFWGRGTIQDVRRLTEVSGPPDRAGVFRAVLENLARLEWNGAWEIRELASLTGFFPELGNVDLRGSLNGKWFIDNSRQPRLHARLEIPAETDIAFGTNLLKPQATAVNVDLAATISPEGASLSDVDADLAVGEGRCSIDGGLVTLRSDDQAFRVNGRFQAQKVESLLLCLRKGIVPVELSGKASGEFSANLAGATDGSAKLDLSGLEIGSGLSFLKPEGQKAVLTVGFRQEEGTGRRSASFTAELEMGQIAGLLEFPESDNGSWRLKMQGEALGAERFAQACPALAQRLGEGRLGGVVGLTADVAFEGRQVDGRLSLEAAGAEYVSAEAVPRRKSVGVPLAVDLEGRLSTDDAGRTVGSLEKGALTFGGSRAQLSGWAAMGRNGPPSRGLLGRKVEAFRGAVDVDIAVDDPLRSMLPEFSDAIARNSIGGQLALSAEAEGNTELISLRSRVDAGNLTLAALAPDQGSAPEDRPTPLVVTKPAGLPAVAALEATIQGDLSRIDLGSLEARVGSLEVQGGCVIELGLAPDGLPRDVIATKGRLTVGAREARDLHQLMPWLEPYELSGSAFLEASWDGLGSRSASAELRLEQLSGVYRGRPLRLTGQVAFSGLGRGDDGKPVIGRLRTDGMEFRAGSSHGWLLADLTGLPDRPAGEFHLLAEYIDEKELADWLAPHRAAATAPPTAEQRQQALQKATDLLVLLRRRLLDCDLNARLSVDRYRTFDASVNQYYEAGFLNVEFSLRRGLFKADSFASINGGSFVSSSRIDLTDDPSYVVGATGIRNVIASENIQPQLAKYFPGNTVFGLFDRTEESKVRLVDLLARVIDPRYPVYPVGEAKTVAVDGLLKAKALPPFVGRIFPGLNLTKYRYNKMTGFAKLQGDGTTVNDMVFSGQTYDIYIEGTTDRDNIGLYEIGLMLLGTPQTAEWNHAYRLGRVPLLKFKARIEGGQMHDEKVTFIYPNEALFVIFLKNNLFYRVWLEAQRK